MDISSNTSEGGVLNDMLGHIEHPDMTYSNDLVGPSVGGQTIGYVVKRYPRFSETFIVNEILAHEAAGQNIEIFALRPVEEAYFQDILGEVRAPVTRLPDKQRSAESMWLLLQKARQGLPSAWPVLETLEVESSRNVSQAILLAMACRERGIAHLHAHFGTVSTTVARLAAKLAGISYSFTAHAKDIYFRYDEPQQLERKIEDAAHVVTVSDFNIDYLRKTFEADSKRLTRIYNGLDLKRFEYSDPEPTAIRMLAVGRLVEKKGFHILVEAVRILVSQGNTVHCDIVGAGDEMRNLREQIDACELHDSLHLVGAKPQREVFNMMRSAALLVCPCVVGQDGNRDGLPTVLVEAMALGLPCVSTNVTGIPELIIDETTGLCVPQEDAEALAAALARMLDDAGLRQRLARAGRALIEKDFDQTCNAARLRDVFQQALDTQAGALQGVA